MARCLCDVADARRLLTPGPVGIVTTAWRDMVNAAPIAWMMPLSMQPPLVAMAVHPHRHTADMLRFSEEFAINIPGPTLLKQVAYLGSLSGLDNNKLEAAALETLQPLSVQAPLIDGCLAWIECGVEDVQRYGDHTLFVGRVVKVQALDEAYAGGWKLEQREFSPLIYLGGTRYSVLGEALEGTFTTNMQGALVLETPEEREEREEREAAAREAEQAEGAEGIEEMRTRDARKLF